MEDELLKWMHISIALDLSNSLSQLHSQPILYSQSLHRSSFQTILVHRVGSVLKTPNTVDSEDAYWA